jgi:hypothetical protein
MAARSAIQANRALGGLQQSNDEQPSPGHLEKA